MITFLSARSMFAGVFVALLVTSGCAPESPPSNPSGRTAVPLWHVARYAVDGPLLMDRNLVFAVARSRNGRRVSAFARANGDLRWTSRFVADRILGIDGQLIFVEEFGSKRDHALDTSTGDERPFARRVGLGPFATSGRVLYAVAFPSDLLALTQRGETIWQRHVPVIVDTDGPPVRAAGTVVVFGSLGAQAYLSRKGFYAFDASTGVLLWKRENISCDACLGGYSAARIVSDGRLIFADRLTGTRAKYAYVLVAFDPKTGAERWHRTRSSNCPDGALPISPGRIFICLDASPAGGGPLPANGLYAEIDGTTGNVLRRVRTGVLYAGGIVRDGSLFVSGASPYKPMYEGGPTANYRWLACVDVRTGKERWRGATETAVEFTAPVASDGIVVVGSRKSMEANAYPVGADVEGLWAWRY